MEVNNPVPVITFSGAKIRIAPSIEAVKRRKGWKKSINEEFH